MTLKSLCKNPKTSFCTGLACTVLSMILAFCFLPEQGILATPDSVAYLHAAETFRNGEGLIFYGYSTPMIQWAALTPIFYAFVGLFTANIPAAMVYVNLALLFVTLFVANLTVCHAIRKPVFALAAQLVLSFNWILWDIHYFLWSEVLFLLFLALLSYFFIRWLQEDKRLLLVGAGISAALMLLSRFSGMELAGLVGLYILFRKGHTWKNRLIDAVIYGLLGATPYCINLLRNYILSGTFTGRSTPALYTFATNLKNTVYHIVEWFDPTLNTDLKRTALLLLVLLALAGLSFVLFLLVYRQADKKPSLAVPLFLLLHCVLYLASSLYANSTYALDGVTGRIISPITFAGVTLFFWLMSQAADYKKTWLRVAVTACAVALALFSFVNNTAHLARTAPRQVSYFSQQTLGGDPAADFLADYDADSVKVWTNRPAELYYLTGLDCNYVPRRHVVELYSWDSCVQRWQESGKDLLICWYDIYTIPAMYQEEEMQQLLNMELLADLGTCRIYEAALP